MLKVTKRFVREMQQKRDVNKLSRDLFVKDGDLVFMGTLLLQELDKSKSNYKLTSQQMRRLSVAWMNYMYIIGLDRVVGDGPFDLTTIVSPSLRPRLLKIEDEMDSLRKNITRNGLQRFLARMERTLAAAGHYLKTKNVEQSRKYKNEIAEREKSDLYNYSVDVTFYDPNDDSDDEIVSLIRRFGPGCKAFSVGTPYGYALFIVKQKKRYKIFGMYPHPISGR